MRPSIAVALSGVALVAACAVASPLGRWEVEHEQEIAAAPEVVWQVLADLARLSGVEPLLAARRGNPAGR